MPEVLKVFFYSHPDFPSGELVDGPRVFDSLHCLLGQLGEVGARQSGVVVRLCVTCHHARVVHHQTCGQVHLGTNHCLAQISNIIIYFRSPQNAAESSIELNGPSKCSEVR